MESGDGTNIRADGERQVGEGFLAEIMDREYVTLNKLPPEVRKQMRVKFDNRYEDLLFHFWKIC